MRVLVVGAGAVGSWVGGRLALAGNQVTLVGRPWYVEAVRAEGLRLVEGGRAVSVPRVCVATSVAQAVAEGSDFDLILFTMKSYDTASSVEELRQVLPEPAPVLSLQNGIGNEEIIAAVFGEEGVIAGTVTVPVTVPGLGVVEARVGRRGIGLASVAGLRSQVSGLRSQVISATCDLRPSQGKSVVWGLRLATCDLLGAGLNVSVYADYRAMKWSKLLLNLVGNATSAILGWPPQRVFADARLFRLEYCALGEALDVMAALGLRPVALPGYPLHLMVPLFRLLPPPLLQRLMVRAVASGRGGKMPSLYLDLERGKGRSEVPFLNGAVVEQGRRLGVPTPVNEVLCQVLMAIVEGRATWEEARVRLSTLNWPSMPC